MKKITSFLSILFSIGIIGCVIYYMTEVPTYNLYCSVEGMNGVSFLNENETQAQIAELGNNLTDLSVNYYFYARSFEHEGGDINGCFTIKSKDQQGQYIASGLGEVESEEGEKEITFLISPEQLENEIGNTIFAVQPYTSEYVLPLEHQFRAPYRTLVLEKGKQYYFKFDDNEAIYFQLPGSQKIQVSINALCEIRDVKNNTIFAQCESFDPRQNENNINKASYYYFIRGKTEFNPSVVLAYAPANR